MASGTSTQHAMIANPMHSNGNVKIDESSVGRACGIDGYDSTTRRTRSPGGLINSRAAECDVSPQSADYCFLDLAALGAA